MRVSCSTARYFSTPALRFLKRETGKLGSEEEKNEEKEEEEEEEEAFDVGGDLFIFLCAYFLLLERYRNLSLYFVKVYVWLLLCFSVEERRCYILNYTCPSV